MSSGQVQVGVHVFEVMLEDFPTKNITLTFANGAQQVLEASNMTGSPLCRVKLQFSVQSKWFSIAPHHHYTYWDLDLTFLSIVSLGHIPYDDKKMNALCCL